jgi:hypothetical protein
MSRAPRYLELSLAMNADEILRESAAPIRRWWVVTGPVLLAVILTGSV